MTKRVDVLLLQLGTPDAPTAAALRPYLREFLSDPRVIEAPAVVRWLLVNLLIVPFRSPSSAKKYERIWDEQTGSPLLSITKAQTEKLAALLEEPFHVEFAMRYGNPSIHCVLERLMQRGCERLVVLPMYPQYSATTTASALDGLFDELKKLRVLPAVRIIRDFHTEDQYIDAVCRGIRRKLEAAEENGDSPRIHLLSFHGIPKSYVDRGDPYQRYASETADLIAQRMGWSDEQWRLTFQSRLGPSEWLTPYTDETLVELGKQGVKTVLVAQPGFTTDCLETIDEIGNEGEEEFREAGGETLIRVPCLNDDDAFISTLEHLVRKEASDWVA